MSMVPEEKKYRINAALEKHNGDRRAAAAELGMEYEALKNAIHNCGDLKLRWSKDGLNLTAQPPTEVETLHRAPPPDVIEEVAKSLIKEDQLLSDGLSKLGLTEHEQSLAMELQEFNRQQFSRSLDITSAGVTRQSLKIMTQLDAIGERLKYVRKVLDDMGEAMLEERPEWVKEEFQLSQAYTALSDQLRKMMSVQYEATKTIAYIKFHQKNQKQAKPGFSSAIPV